MISLHKVNWGLRPTITDYETTVIENLEQLSNVLSTPFKELSFDYETSPAKEETARLKAKIEELKEDPDVMEAELPRLMRDYEYASLDSNRADVCVISFCMNTEKCYVAFCDSGEAQAYITMLIHAVRKYDAELIAYNVAFESKMTERYGIHLVGKIIDPFIAIVRIFQIVKIDEIPDPKSPATGKGLKNMAKWLGYEQQEYHEVLERHNVKFFNQLPKTEDVIRYAADDAIVTLHLKRYFETIGKQIPIRTQVEGLNTYWDWLCQIEMPFHAVIGHMEHNGMEWNREMAGKLRIEASRRMREASNTIKDTVNSMIEDPIFKRECQERGLLMRDDVVVDRRYTDNFKVASLDKFKDLPVGKTGKTKIVKEFLYDFCNSPVVTMSDKTGAVSMDKESIIDTLFLLHSNLVDLKEEKYLGIVPNADPDLRTAPEIKASIIQNRPERKYRKELITIFESIRTIQKYSTLLSSHLEGREKYVNSVTGRIHSSYSTFTETCRTNSRYPNAQNVPNAHKDELGIRKLYRPTAGKVFMLIDYAGVELRIMAVLSGDESMRKILNEGGDVHMNSACTMTGKKPEDVSKKERDLAKAGNFGINYGGTEYALQSTLKTMGIRASLDECCQIINAIKTAYPGILKYQREMANYASKHMFVQTLCGYKRFLPYINSHVRGLRNAEERKATNTPIQGSVADIMKLAQIRILKFIDQYGLTEHMKMCAQIHDEIIFEINDDFELICEIKEKMVEIMETHLYEGFEVPLKVDVSIAKESWYNKISWEDYVNEKKEKDS